MTFADNICHRHCSAPDLTMRRATWRPAELTPLAARMILAQEDTDACGAGTLAAALAYPVVPGVAFRQADGELTSALVSILLSYGFELAISPEFPTSWTKPPAWTAAAA